MIESRGVDISEGRDSYTSPTPSLRGEINQILQGWEFILIKTWDGLYAVYDMWLVASGLMACDLMLIVTLGFKAYGL